jgi:hypothetical protein
MSQSLAVGHAPPRPAAQQRLAGLEPRRALQLALGVLWLLDGMLQFQPFMFGRGFPQMLAGSAAGNPAAVARPITWSATLISHHEVLLNAVFAAVQLLLGLGIAWRPTVKLALGASVAWALSVWWLGEGLGGLLAGTASPVSGAPGAVILYALLAVLLWPADRDPSAPSVAARTAGRHVALGSWLVVWLGLAVLALLPASRAPQAISGTISDMASDEPVWLAWVDNHLASALAGHGLPASIVLAALLGAIALGILLPASASASAPAAARRAGIVLAVAVAIVLWLAQGLGGMLTGSGTDPDSGPLLALLALAFWPLAAPAPPAVPAPPAGPAASAASAPPAAFPGSAVSPGEA